MPATRTDSSLPALNADVVLDRDRLADRPFATFAGECFPDYIRRRRGGRIDWRAIPRAQAHRGVTHVRGKDCVHPDIGLVIVRMISFPARERGQRARMAVR